MSFVKSYTARQQVEFHASLEIKGEAQSVILGRVGYRGLVLWCDGSGDPIQTISYGYKNLRITFVSALQIVEGDLCILGEVSGHDDKFILLRINEQGQIDWERYVYVPNGTGSYFLTAPHGGSKICLLYTSPSPRDLSTSRMPSSA